MSNAHVHQVLGYRPTAPALHRASRLRQRRPDHFPGTVAYRLRTNSGAGVGPQPGRRLSRRFSVDGRHPQPDAWGWRANPPSDQRLHQPDYFRPDKTRYIYSKQYLHPDEEAFFISGGISENLAAAGNNVALASCSELPVPAHAVQASTRGATVYAASVAKFASGVERAAQRLSHIARSYALTVVMANAVGPADGGECAGQTAVWNHQGILVAQLDNRHEGQILYDTDTQA